MSEPACICTPHAIFGVEIDAACPLHGECSRGHCCCECEACCDCGEIAPASFLHGEGSIDKDDE